MPQDEKGHVAQDDSCKTGDKQTNPLPCCIPATHYRNEQKDGVDFGKRGQADQYAGQYTTAGSSIGRAKYGKYGEREGNDIDVTFEGKFDDGQGAPGIDDDAARIESLALEE